MTYNTRFEFIVTQENRCYSNGISTKAEVGGVAIGRRSNTS